MVVIPINPVIPIQSINSNLINTNAEEKEKQNINQQKGACP